MSTSLLYHAFGVCGYRYVKSEFIGGKVVFTVEPEQKALSCTACGSPEVIRRGEVKPKLKHLKHLAIDEIAVRKGHRYLTVVLVFDGGTRPGKRCSGVCR